MQTWSSLLGYDSYDASVVIFATSSGGIEFSFIKWRMKRIGSDPRSIASRPLIFFPAKRCGGKCDLNFISSSFCMTMSATSLRASRSFIFINGQVAHPPAVLHPSPPDTPGTTEISSSSTPVTASEATGKIISVSTLLDLAAAMISCTDFTIDVTIPASVPRMNFNRLFSPDGFAFSFSIAAVTFLEINFRMSEVEPTVPWSVKLCAIAISNISPGTSKCAVTYASS
mmetsp:Transcript_21795/g.32321  ORF Transcript_21795/g.32321 Transcript_21795/m.32321 type:complete len:227 (+) Transcript_21795:36-716(+)